MKLRSLHRAILETVAYTDQFAYPLLESELWQRLVWSHVDHAAEPLPTRTAFRAALADLAKAKYLTKEWHYWCLAGCETTVPTRRQRNHWAAEKWYLAEELIKAAEHIPWIEGIAVTGAMAMANPATPDDDVDVLIVTAPGRLWLSRLWLILLAWHHGRRRSWHGEEKNSWCLNLWLDDRHLAIPQSRHSLYTAYEVIQAKWLSDRAGVQAQFYFQNQWVKQWLPNAMLSVEPARFRRRRKSSPLAFAKAQVLLVLKPLTTLIGNGAEWGAYAAQSWYMRAHRTREVVQPGMAFFHPRDTKGLIERRWHKRLERMMR